MRLLPRCATKYVPVLVGQPSYSAPCRHEVGSEPARLCLLHPAQLIHHCTAPHRLVTMCLSLSSARAPRVPPALRSMSTSSRLDHSSSAEIGKQGG